MKNQEIEIKFLLADMPAFEERLQQLGAKLILPRVYEKNLRFDTPAGDFTREQRVLRLRQDSANRITYKDSARVEDEVSIRREIEFSVDDFDSAQAFLQALGYQISIFYEKYRATYAWNDIHITLDEMPFGNFTELEGEHPELLRDLANRLHLDWNKRNTESYMALFSHILQNRQLNIQHVSFDAFAGITIQPADMRLSPADQ